MRKRQLYGLIWVLTLLTVLTGCEDIFYREVDFQGETEPEMLVVTGNWFINTVPTVLVSHSFFFDRTDKRKDDWIRDAEVHMRVNGQPYDLSYQNDIYANYSMPPLRTGDTVEITASHPKYETVTARQVMPGQVRCTVSHVELLSTKQIAFQLDLDAYEGNEDDLIGIWASGTIEGTWTGSYGAKETHTEPITLNTLYSNDILFAGAENASTEGYYGALPGYYLYFPASELREPKSIQLFVDSDQLQWTRTYDSVRAKQLEVRAMACTYSAYRFEQSMRGSFYLKALPPPSHLPQSENFMEEIMVAIQSMLGDQEPVQVYSNVEDGLGHVAAFSIDSHTIDFE